MAHNKHMGYTRYFLSQALHTPYFTLRKRVGNTECTYASQSPQPFLACLRERGEEPNKKSVSPLTGATRLATGHSRKENRFLGVGEQQMAEEEETG